MAWYNSFNSSLKHFEIKTTPITEEPLKMLGFNKNSYQNGETGFVYYDMIHPKFEDISIEVTPLGIPDYVLINEYRKELIQLDVVAIQAVECLDRELNQKGDSKNG